MPKTKPDIEHVVEELQAVKRLLIAMLARDGLSQAQIASVLDVNQSSVSRMFPAGLPKPRSGTSANGRG